jgi:acyl carrier protein
VDVLQTELKELIIKSFNLEDITPDDIDASEELFGAGLGLDSIDALELGLVIKKNYNITVDAGDPNIREHFASVANLAAYISSNGTD